MKFINNILLFIILQIVIFTIISCGSQPVKKDIKEPEVKEEKEEEIVETKETNIPPKIVKTNIIEESIKLDVVLDEDFATKLSKNFNSTNYNNFRVYGNPLLLPGGKIKSVFIKYEDNDWTNMIENNGKFYFDFNNLKQGTNIFWAYAVDVNNYTSETDVMGILVDTEGPELSIDSPSNNQVFIIDKLPYELKVIGNVKDNYSSIKELVVFITMKNKTNSYECIVKDNQYIGKIKIQSLGKYEIWVEAKDYLNNLSKSKNINIYFTSLAAITID